MLHMSDGESRSNEQDPEDLRILRGFLFALPISIVLWLVIGAIAYGIYRVLRG